MVQITLKVKFKEEQLLTTNKYRLTATVTQYGNIPREIFVFQYNLDETSVFQTVALPVMIEKHPATVPTHKGSFYRRHEVVLDFDLLEQREEARDIMEARIDRLVKEWEALFPFIVEEEEVEFIYGTV